MHITWTKKNGKVYDLYTNAQLKSLMVNNFELAKSEKINKENLKNVVTQFLSQSDSRMVTLETVEEIDSVLGKYV